MPTSNFRRRNASQPGRVCGGWPQHHHPHTAVGDRSPLLHTLLLLSLGLKKELEFLKANNFFQDVFNFTGRQIEVQGRNIQERTTIYTKLETVGQVLSFCLIQDEFFSNDYELVQMLGSISATDGHACMLRAMCEVSKLLSSHTGAILRKKSSLIV